MKLMVIFMIIFFIHPSNGEAKKLFGSRKLGMGKRSMNNLVFLGLNEAIMNQWTAQKSNNIDFLGLNERIMNRWTAQKSSDIVIVNENKNRYAVIFDAGSSGSRVHVYCFDHNLNLVPFADGLELFVHTTPGLSAYADDPEAAASSLVPLLEKAEDVIPKQLHGETPVKLGATAGLRMLPGDAPEKILQAVKDLLKDKSDLMFNPDWVTVLDGTQEGAFLWVAINYLLGNLGNEYSQTVGVVDLGGGSVQLSYALSESAAATAPNVTEGQEAYVKNMFLKDRNYHLYVHSYLNYGLLAARAEILKTIEKSENPCVLAGYHGSYTYGGVTYEVSASPSGGQFDSCRAYVLMVLNVNQTCTYMQCTFSGIWNGGGGDGQKSMYVGSFFYDRAAQAGFIDSNKTVVTVRPSAFMEAAKLACETNLEVAKSRYTNVDESDLPYLCMDLVYQYSLLVDGFGLNSSQTITLVKRVPYQNSLVEAAWPLGSAIDVMSSLTRPRVS